ncbi:trehalose utilization protein [Enterococcus sp. PF1-24]|uniref:ThuA domain-containing protein n=1 Tax=unclassified Enterococcus TaxID=2608891 RepID=UPI00247498B7|nr:MULTISPECIES: ThuA domain-containing protein [unclassified Enterococcus]MDH6363441.1 trehalose utilization protein [Enterococcus sp. PFB1-1]MDH6400535.1 trehalose utilization protein [Enterococcus sp. PF1-24]
MKVTVWNEYRHEKIDEAVNEMYPAGIHGQLAKFIADEETVVQTATLDEAEHGLSSEVLAETDVLLWWGHVAHEEVADEIVERVYQRVLEGMGLIVLHSGHFSKIFKKLMGTSCDLKWREDEKHCRVWNINPGHPIATGIEDYFELEKEEMYGEHFDIPQPDELIFVSWFPGGEVFRSGCTYRRGNGKIFYFQPGHETYPSYYDENVQKIIKNAVKWCAPTKASYPKYGHFQALEKNLEGR